MLIYHETPAPGGCLEIPARKSQIPMFFESTGAFPPRIFEASSCFFGDFSGVKNLT